MLSLTNVAVLFQLIRADDDLGAVSFKPLDLIKANVKAAVELIAPVNAVRGDHGMAEAIDEKRDQKRQRNQPGDRTNDDAEDPTDQRDQKCHKADHVRNDQKQRDLQKPPKNMCDAEFGTELDLSVFCSSSFMSGIHIAKPSFR